MENWELIENVGSTHLYKNGENYKIVYDGENVLLNINSDLSGQVALGAQRINNKYRVIWKNGNKYYFSEYNTNGDEIKEINKQIGPKLLKKQEELFGQDFNEDGDLGTPLQIENKGDAKLYKNSDGSYFIRDRINDSTDRKINLLVESDITDKEGLGALKINGRYRVIWKNGNKYYFSVYDVSGNEVKGINKQIGPKLLKKQEELFNQDFNNDGSIGETTTTTTAALTTECITTTSSVNVISSNGNKYVLNGASSYSETIRYGLNTGTYTFTGIPVGHPLAILNKGNSNITYSGDSNNKLTKSVSGTTADGTYDFYYGTVTVVVNGDFGNVSLYCHHHGYMGGKNLLVYSPSCSVGSSTTTTTAAPTTTTTTTSSSTGTWNQTQVLSNNDRNKDDYFAYCIDMTDNYAIVGQWRDYDNDPTDTNYNDPGKKGHAYIFKRNTWSWSLQQKLVVPNSDSHNFFGKAVAIDGDYAMTATPDGEHADTGNYDGDDGDDADSRGDGVPGKLYIYRRDGNSWIYSQKIEANSSAPHDGFGTAISISGEYAIVGAAEGHRADRGSAYILRRDGTNWSETQQLVASDKADDDKFGYSVAIDGSYAVCGAHHDDDKGSASGSAYIFKLDGGSWKEVQKLTASNGRRASYFGDSVAISGDYIVVGADGYQDRKGIAYVFKRNGSTWTEIQKLEASDGRSSTNKKWTAPRRADSGDRFGWKVSISGNYILVSAPGRNNSTGGVYVFEKNGDIWTEKQTLLAVDGEGENDDESEKGDWLGDSLAMSGNYAFVGAPEADDEKGQVIVFTLQ